MTLLTCTASCGVWEANRRAEGPNDADASASRASGTGDST